MVFYSVWWRLFCDLSGIFQFMAHGIKILIQKCTAVFLTYNSLSVQSIVQYNQIVNNFCRTTIIISCQVVFLNHSFPSHDTHNEIPFNNQLNNNFHYHFSWIFTFFVPQQSIVMQQKLTKKTQFVFCHKKSSKSPWRIFHSCRKNHENSNIKEYLCVNKIFMWKLCTSNFSSLYSSESFMKKNFMLHYTLKFCFFKLHVGWHATQFVRQTENWRYLTDGGL